MRMIHIQLKFLTVKVSCPPQKKFQSGKPTMYIFLFLKNSKQFLFILFSCIFFLKNLLFLLPNCVPVPKSETTDNISPVWLIVSQNFPFSVASNYLRFSRRRWLFRRGCARSFNRLLLTFHQTNLGSNATSEIILNCLFQL